MQLLDLTLPTADENLALDEALLLAAEDGSRGEVLRFWENSAYAVVIGSGGSKSIDVNEANCERDGIAICRRSSGGGTVVVGPACLCFTLILRYDRDPILREIAPSARYVLQPLARALAALSPEVAIDGISDLTISGRKVSGSAQQRKRMHFLHHGTLLCGFDLEQVGRYLNAPERQPDYRDERSHAEFVTNAPIDIARAKAEIVEAWQPASEYLNPPLDRVRELIAEKYGRAEWVGRR